MERITRPGSGLFPSPKEIRFSCSCPDSATMCKHIAATLYGIGARLDAEPHLLFGLRKVDAKELIAQAGEGEALPQKAPRAGRILDSSKLADVFGIDLPGVDPRSSVMSPAKTPARPSAKRKMSLPPPKAKTVTRKPARAGRKPSGKNR
jgi:uncharacterized Zn finger protein